MAKHILLAWVFLASLCGTARAQQVQAIEVVEYGIYTADVTNRLREADGTSRSTLGNVRHATTTNIVPAEQGVRFGFRYRIVGSPGGTAVQLRKVTIFPPPGLRKPGLSQPLQRTDYQLSRQTGETSYTGYALDEPWELAPGTWTFQLWQGDRLLLEKSFTVAKRQ